MPDLAVAGDGDTLVVLGVIGGDDDPLHPVRFEAPGEGGHGQGSHRILAPRHGHRGVVENLVRDVDAGRDGVVDGEAARVEERAVADVLEEVRRLGKRGDAHPLRSLRAHVGDPDDAAVHAHGHAVTADTRGGHRALGHHRRPVVGAARAEVGRPRQRQRLRPVLELVDVTNARLDGVHPHLARDALGDGPRDRVGVELAHDGDEEPVLFVALAHDAGPVRHGVERVLGEHLDEGPLLLDDENLLEALGELAHHPRLHGKEHPHLENADAVTAQLLVVETELDEGLPDVVVGLARGHDAEPGVRGGHDDAIELVLVGVELGQLEPRVVQGPLHVQAIGRDQVDIDQMLEGPAIQLDGRDDRVDPLRRGLGRPRLVGDIGHDLHAHPQAGDAREHETVQAQVEDLLDIAGKDRGHEGIVERDFRVAGQRRRLGHGIVAHQGEHAAVLAHSRVVRVLEGIARPVHAGSLAVPHAEHAVVLRAREEPHHLAAEHRGGAEVLVEPRREHHVVGFEQLALTLQRLVEAAQGRPAVARDEGGGTEPAALVGPVLVERKPDQGLGARQIDAPRLLGEFRIQREALGRCGHGTPCWGGGSLHGRGTGCMVMVGDSAV